MKILGSTKFKITKDENSKIVSRLEITEVLLIRYNIVNNDSQQDSGVWYIVLPNKSFTHWSITRYFTKKNNILKNF